MTLERIKLILVHNLNLYSVCDEYCKSNIQKSPVTMIANRKIKRLRKTYKAFLCVMHGKCHSSLLIDGNKNNICVNKEIDKMLNNDK